MQVSGLAKGLKFFTRHTGRPLRLRVALPDQVHVFAGTVHHPCGGVRPVASRGQQLFNRFFMALAGCADSTWPTLR
ncbi:GAF domain/GGDEF domain/EAL domain-containing protein [Pseudomonas mandelii JR-1]|uniref:GAF domain/GGDEF domain/EAL domain-containing protein n=1 Tax=Pseudomonas mandelii JR-1 TaxID=1147786 RepID=A0A024E4P3_9PSED|nr:GAF domain/GGDEF domain/EAL domain-containing protein [Pseudomonas mandelii JR-1]